MRVHLRHVALAAAAALAMTACQSAPEAAIEAEAFSQETLDDPKIPIGPGATIQVEAFEWGFNVVGTPVDGPVVIQFINAGGATHNFRIDNAAGETKKIEAEGGQSAEGELLLFGGGSYTYYCDIPGHKAQGMEGSFTVERA